MILINFKMMIAKGFIKRVLLAFFLLLNAYAFAGETIYSNYKDKTDVKLLPAPTKVRTIDLAAASQEGACPSCWAVVSRKCKVRLNYVRNGRTDVMSSPSSVHNYWTYEVQYKIYATSNPSVFQTGSVKISHGTDQSSNSISVYEDIEVHNLAYTDATLEVTNVIATSSPDGNTYSNVTNPYSSSLIPSDIRLELLISAEKYKDIYTNSTTVPFINFNSTSQELTWNYIPGAEEYDVEWTFIDVKDNHAPFVNGEDPFLYKAGTRITTTSQFYRIDLSYPAGIVYFRVRAVGRHINNVSGNYTIPLNGDWGYKINNQVGTLPLSYTINTSFESNKNWQYVISFAEDGKYKKVMSYFDGSLRNRQSLTNVSSDNTTVIGETKYDSEGRGVIGILPVPVSGNSLSYRVRFNVDGSLGELTESDFEQGTSNPVGNSTGAGQYYSASNTFTNDPFRNYIPDAGGAGVTNSGGYPYTQVEYTRDNTGRIKRSSGVGPDHKLGSTHQSSYFYGTANSTELHTMFGTNVGKASHYKKNLVRDPNGQISVSYMDQEGRVIATALAGTAPANLIALDYNTPQTLTVSLNDNNVVDAITHKSINISKILNVTEAPASTPYTFTYDMNGVVYTNSFASIGQNLPMTIPPTFKQPSVCADCKYKLSISITDPDGLVVQIPDPSLVNVVTRTLSNSTTPDCDTNTFDPVNAPVSFTVNFNKVGNYTVTKVLELDTTGIAQSINNALTAAGLGSSYLTSLINEFKSKVDTTVCDMTCEQHCRSKILAENPTWDPNDPLDTANINSAVRSCVATECGAIITQSADTMAKYGCESILNQMKLDVMPNGPDGPGFHYIESNNISLNGFWKRVNDVITNNQYTFKDANGNTVTSISYLSNPANWQSDWVNGFVLAHREYCHYTDCISMQTSNAYDMKVALATGWNDANTKGYLDPLARGNAAIAGGIYGISTTTAGKDPYFQPSPPFSALNNAMWTKMTTHPNYGNVWTYVNNSANGVYGTSFPFNDANKWKLFRGIYLALKEELHSQSLPSGCPYYNDDYTIVPAPPAFNSNTQFNQLVTDNMQNWTDCGDACAINAQVWMDSLAAQCGLATPTYTQAQLDAIKNDLIAYCESTCGPGNPLAIITNEAVAAGTDANLNAALAKIQALNASCGLSPVSIPSPYQSCVTQSVTTSRVDPCFRELVRFINNEVLPVYTSPNTTCYRLTGNANYSFTCTLPNSYLQVKPTELNFADATCAAACSPVYKFYLANGTVINIDDMISIPSVVYVSVSPVSPAPTGVVYKGIKATILLNNGPVDAYVYGSNTCTGPNTLSTKKDICVVDSLKMNYGITINMDSIHKACVEQLMAEAAYNAQQYYNAIVHDFTQQYLTNHFSNCFSSSLWEDFHYQYESREYHYTLYYYDQAGNLTQTVPPLGYTPVSATAFNSSGVYDNVTEPQHKYITKYTQNSLNALLTQSTPDAGTTIFKYDLKGRIAVSQNAKQAAASQATYSYTKYDAQSRIIEVGQAASSTALTDATVEDQAALNSWLASATLSEVTRTYYDVSMAGAPLSEFTSGTQDNLRSRVASVTITEGSGPAAPVTYATHYSYDEHGNVKELVQDIASLSNLNNNAVRYKKITYKYDLVSGNVNEVAYQKGEVDQFFHRYEYDADNRITIAMTSSDGEIWEKDAKYFYYKHGPLGRAEIGEDKVQGIDYAYTLHGWIKGVNDNTLTASRDMGKDGNSPGNVIDVNNKNNAVARDAYGYTLGYYDTDYKDIGGITQLNHFQATAAGTPLSPSTYNLFNGNISHMVTALMDNNENPLVTQGMAYRYDQLNRIKEAKALRKYTTSDQVAAANSFSGAVINGTGNGDYYEAYSYDANGNITSLTRNGWNASSMGQVMDQLSYTYENVANAYGTNTNKLRYVTEGATTSTYTTDIDNQSANNYTYDQIGNLIGDVQENISSIEWSVYGKIRKVNRNSNANKDLEFKYDAMGNRICKIAKPRSNGTQEKQESWTYTYYVRDAQGNVMAVYDRNVDIAGTTVTDKFTLKELDLYGSSRIGTKNVNLVTGGVTFTKGTAPNDYNSDGELIPTATTNITPDPISPTERKMKLKTYELTNHLGNVIAVVSDKKLGIATTSTTPSTATYYTADVISSSDYYSFGQQMEGRYFNTPAYRYGFNGKESDSEWDGGGSMYDYGFRIYNPRLGKFLSVDPLKRGYPMLTPYQFAGNSPIANIDLDGAEPKSSINTWKRENEKTQNGQQVYQVSDAGKVWTVAQKNNWDVHGNSYFQFWDPRTGRWEHFKPNGYIDQTPISNIPIQPDNSTKWIGDFKKTVKKYDRQFKFVTITGGLAAGFAAGGLGGLAGGVEGGGSAIAAEAVEEGTAGGTAIGSEGLAAFSPVEQNVITEANSILSSDGIQTLKAAFQNGVSTEVNIGGRTILYEPDLPASGFTLFSENGFALGNEAFSSSEELGKTVLQELYRLANSSIPTTGASATAVSSETQAAWQFAEKAFEYLKY